MVTVQEMGSAVEYGGIVMRGTQEAGGQGRTGADRGDRGDSRMHDSSRTELLEGIFLRVSDAAVLGGGEDRGRDHVVVHALGRAAELRSQKRAKTWARGIRLDQIASTVQ